MKKYNDREAYVVEMLAKYKTQAPSNILSDIGSGWGWLKPHAEKNNLIWQPFDYVSKIKEATIWDLNQTCPDTAKPAGICVMLEVLEHLANPMISIQHIAEHMLPGAIMIMSVPNPSWSHNRIHLLSKGSLYSFQKKHLEEHHVFTPWKHIVEFFFEQNGFEILEYHAIIQIKYKPVDFKTLILFILQRIIEKRDPLSAGLSYGLVLKKK